MIDFPRLKVCVDGLGRCPRQPSIFFRLDTARQDGMLSTQWASLMRGRGDVPKGGVLLFSH